MERLNWAGPKKLGRSVAELNAMEAVACASRLRVVCHDGKEFLLVDLPVLVQIELVYHCLPERGAHTGLASLFLFGGAPD